MVLLVGDIVAVEEGVKVFEVPLQLIGPVIEEGGGSLLSACREV